MGVNTCMSLKLDPVDLMLYADVAEAFENWLINNPVDLSEPLGMKQSRVFAKSYLNLYVTFLQMFQYVPKEEMEYETVGQDGVKRRFDAVESIYLDLKESTNLTEEDKKAVMTFKDKVKPTLH